MDQNRYIVMKLSTGEDVIAVAHSEDDTHWLLLHPMHIQKELDMDHHVEQYYAQPLCPFSDDNTYTMAKRHVMYAKPLSKYLIPFYHDMVKQFSESELIKNARQRAEKKVSWGGKEISEEEARRRIKELQKVRELHSLGEDDDTTIH